MATCNKCSLAEIEKDAKKTGATVHVLPAEPPGEDLAGQQLVATYPDAKEVFVVPEGEVLNTKPQDNGHHSKQWTSWFAEIPERCGCKA